MELDAHVSIELLHKPEAMIGVQNECHLQQQPSLIDLRGDLSYG